MPKWFNTAGPCKADIHYMLPPLARLPRLEPLIAQQGYFVIHAPRQTGKTTAMLSLAQDLTKSGNYTAIMLSAEVGAAFPNDPKLAEQVILENWSNTASFRLPSPLHPPNWLEASSPPSLGKALSQWAQRSPRPLVVFIDEIDALRDETLIYVLRQLRSGYPHRPEGFPQSLALIGVRDVRDYKMASGGSNKFNAASPFNIKVESLTLRNFNAAEIEQLYSQHTEHTGQVFEQNAIQRSYELTQGQPWLVNALARLIVETIQPDPSQAITLQHMNIAKETLILRQNTHLDSLVSILQEDRVRAIMEPMLAGQALGKIPNDDRQFLVDLGLVKRQASGGLAPANPIYKEVLPRVLASGPQDSLPTIQPSWLNADGNFKPEQLLQAFLTFWRQHRYLRGKSYDHPYSGLILKEMPRASTLHRQKIVFIFTNTRSLSPDQAEKQSAAKQ